MWHDMFLHMVPMQLPLLEKIVRPIVVYVFLIIGLRVAGKRELAQLNPFDFIVLLMLSNTVQNAIIGDDNSVSGGIVGAVSLLLVNHLVVRLTFKRPRFNRWVEGRRDTLVRNGKILKDHLDRELMSRAELMAAAHKQGIDTIDQIHSCVIEPNGTFTFIQETPTVDNKRHDELIKHLTQLISDVTSLKAAHLVPSPGALGDG